jgi:hypothetical protein
MSFEPHWVTVARAVPLDIIAILQSRTSFTFAVNVPSSRPRYASFLYLHDHRQPAERTATAAARDVAVSNVATLPFERVHHCCVTSLHAWEAGWE